MDKAGIANRSLIRGWRRINIIVIIIKVVHMSSKKKPFQGGKALL